MTEGNDCGDFCLFGRAAAAGRRRRLGFAWYRSLAATIFSRRAVPMGGGEKVCSRKKKLSSGWGGRYVISSPSGHLSAAVPSQTVANEKNDEKEHQPT